MDYGTTYLDFHGLGPPAQIQAVPSAHEAANPGSCHRTWCWPALGAVAPASKSDAKKQGAGVVLVSEHALGGTAESSDGFASEGSVLSKQRPLVLGRIFAIPGRAPSGPQRRRQAGGLPKEPVPQKRHFFAQRGASAATAATPRAATAPQEDKEHHAKEYDFTRAREGRMTPRRRYIVSDKKNSIFHQVEPTEMVLRDYKIQREGWR